MAVGFIHKVCGMAGVGGLVSAIDLEHINWQLDMFDGAK
jgi:hypothetical protein